MVRFHHCSRLDSVEIWPNEKIRVTLCGRNTKSHQILRVPPDTNPRKSSSHHLERAGGGGMAQWPSIRQTTERIYLALFAEPRHQPTGDERPDDPAQSRKRATASLRTISISRNFVKSSPLFCNSRRIDDADPSIGKWVN
jgi:hypothetical protein